MIMITWAWHIRHGCHTIFSKDIATFKHFTKNTTNNQNFSKIVFASFHMMQEASERYMKHFSICNIKGAEKFSWSFPVHLFPGVPGLWKRGTSLLCPCRVIVSYFSLMVIKGTLCFIKPPYISIFKEI